MLCQKLFDPTVYKRKEAGYLREETFSKQNKGQLNT